MNYVGKIVEDIRVDRGMRIEDLVSGVISKRQYLRYKKGEYDITNNNLAELLNRLDIDFATFARQLESSKYSIKYQLLSQFKLLNEMEYTSVYNFLNRIDETQLYSTFEEKLYELLNVVTRFNLNRITQEHYVFCLKRIIDYPNCLSRDLLNVVEVNGLLFLIQIEPESIDYEKLFRKMLHINEIKEIPWYDVLLVNISLAQQLVNRGDYEEAIKLATSIDDTIRTETKIKAYTNLMYFKLFSQKKLNSADYEVTLNRFKGLLLFEENEHRMKSFEENYKRIFGEELELE